MPNRWALVRRAIGAGVLSTEAAQALGDGSIAIGGANGAILGRKKPAGAGAMALGGNSDASGLNSIAMGVGTVADQTFALAIE